MANCDYLSKTEVTWDATALHSPRIFTSDDPPVEPNNGEVVCDPLWKMSCRP